MGTKLKFGQLILRKIIKIVATRCHILKLKCTKFDVGWGSAPDPAGGAHSAPPDPYLHLRGPTSKGMGLERGEEGEERVRVKGEGIGGRKGRGMLHHGFGWMGISGEELQNNITKNRTWVAKKMSLNWLLKNDYGNICYDQLQMTIQHRKIIGVGENGNLPTAECYDVRPWVANTKITLRFCDNVYKSIMFLRYNW